MRRYRQLFVVIVGAILLVGAFAAPAAACDECCCECRSPGFWKNHPGAWPVSSITIGGVSYTKSAAIAGMKQIPGDKSSTLFRSLVAAKLNLLVGCDACGIEGVVGAADAWMAANPLGSGVAGSSCEWDEGECLYWRLDAFNNNYF